MKKAVRRKKYWILLLAVLVLSIGVLVSCTSRGGSSNEDEPTSEQGIEKMRGLFLYSQNNLDYPSKPGLSNRDLADEASNIINFAKTNGYSALFFQVRSESDALYSSKVYPHSRFFTEEEGAFSFSDPLDILTGLAKDKGIAVYAVVDPYRVGSADRPLSDKNPAKQHPDWTIEVGGQLYYDPANEQVQQLVEDGILELSRQRNLAGILLQDIDNAALKNQEHYYDNLQTVLENCQKKINSYQPEFLIGLSSQSTAVKDESQRTFYKSVSQNDTIDFIAPKMITPTSLDEDGYTDILSQWLAVVDSTSVQLVPDSLAYRILSPTFDGYYFSDPLEINYQMVFNHSKDITCSLVENYSSLKFNVYPIAQDLLTVYQSDTVITDTDLNLEIPQTFAITRPTEKISTTYDHYFITGLSDPALPLTVDGQEVDRRTDYGGFGVYVQVAVGENTYVFEQGEQTATVQIDRPDPNQTAQQQPISTIVSSSAAPKYDLAVFSDKEVALQCIAPSGGKVTASVNGVNYDLKQAAAEDGLPALYTATIKIDHSASLSENATTAIGNVVYTLTYNGIVTNEKSAGTLYYVGSNHRLAVKTANYLGNVMKNPKDNGDFLATFKNGALDYVSDQTDDYYLLESGGYIKKSEVDIVEGTANVDNHVTNVVLDSVAKGEKLTVAGSNYSAAHVDFDENNGVLTLTLYHAYGMPESLSYLKSELFEEISVKNDEEHTAVITLRLKEGQVLYGYDLTYSDNNTVLYCKKPPQLSENYSKPLEGITVVIDPGHGGKDVGALGVGGTAGPIEKEINFAAAYTTMQRLKSMGATVYLTRSDDSVLALDDRLALAQQNDADFFISFHHNSTAESRNSYETAGLEIYYHEQLSKSFAENLMERLSVTLNRQNRGVIESYYRVTRITYAPAVLVELGYIPNPVEYESLCSPFELYKTACAVSSAIKSQIEQY